MTTVYLRDRPAPGRPLTAREVTLLRSDLDEELRRVTPAESAADGSSASLPARAAARRLEVLDALARFKAGTYGTCVRCRARIPYERLAIIPEARTCIRCGPDPRVA